ncbi:MAG TPA: FtsQ-type POTRA domain-containing protein [Gemmatimonadales bacterium]|nr:FtsQ-type POTRA domain-containing protein [Gemmatimonadales bacterium]
MAQRGLRLVEVRHSRLRLGLKSLAALFVLSLAWLAAPKVLQRLEFFRIRRVEISGLQYLAPAKVAAALGLNAEATVFDDLAAVARRIRALPGVSSAEVRRRFPGTLEIDVVEAVPVALVPRIGGMALLDSNGQMLSFDPAISAPDLPVAASGDRSLARVLASVQMHDPVLFGRIRAARRVRDDVLLDVAGRRFWFGPSVTAEDIRAVMAVAQDLAREGRQYQELDGRFAGQVIVRAGV